MRVNGRIWVKNAVPLSGTETGFDEGGNPIPAAPDWRGPLDACVETLSDDRRASYEDGKYRRATYRIYTEIPRCGPAFQPTQIKLCLYGEMLGEFAVISCIMYPTVGRVELIV